MRSIFQAWHGRLRRHEAYHFAYDSVVVFIGSTLTALMFVLFHALIRRMLGNLGRALDYSNLVALLGLLNVLGVPAAVITITMARYVAEYVHRNDSATWLLLLRRSLKIAAPAGLTMLALWCLITPWLRAELKAPSIASLVMVGVIAFVNLFGPFLGGALQGSRRFGWGAISSISIGISRLLLAVVVVLLGGGITALLGAVAGSAVVGLLTAWWPLRHIFQTTPSDAVILPKARAVHGFFWTVMLGQIALLLFSNADVIFSPRFLAGKALEAYGPAAMLSRAVFFLPAPIITAMFPRAVTSGNPRLLLGPVLFTLFVCLAAALFMTLFPELPMRLMYNINDPFYAALMRRYVWAVIPLALLNILSPYLWARHEAARTLWLVPALGVYLLLLALFHQTPQQMIACLLAGGLVALAVMAWLTWRVLRSNPPMGVAANGGS